MSDDEQVDFITRQGRVPFGVELRIVDEDGKELPRDGTARAASSCAGRG